MSRHAALPISLYVRGRRVVMIADDWRAGELPERRAAQFEFVDARVERVRWRDYTAAACEGAFIVALQHEGPSPRDVTPVETIAEDARAAGALVYVADRPELGDFAMPGVVARGALKLAVSSDAVAPALTRRIRDELQRLVSDAGPAIDALLARLVRLRAGTPRGERAARLERAAARLRVRGSIEIDGSDSD